MSRWLVPFALLGVPLVGGLVLWAVTGADVCVWLALGVAAAISVSGST